MWCMYINVLDVVWSSFGIDTLFPAIWEFNVVTPIFGGWQPSGRSSYVTVIANKMKLVKFVEFFGAQ